MAHTEPLRLSRADARHKNRNGHAVELTDEETQILAQQIDPDEPKAALYKFDDTTQQFILGLLLGCPDLIQELRQYVKPSYFRDDVHKFCAKYVFDCFDQTGAVPEPHQLRLLLVEKINAHVEDRTKRLRWQAELTTCGEYYVPGLGTRELTLKQIKDFAKLHSFKQLWSDSFDQLARNPNDISSVISDAASHLTELNNEPETNERRGFKIKELLQRPRRPWLVKDHFHANSFIAMFGPPEVGKSFVAIDSALSISTGLPYLGQYPVAQGPVVYIASEGDEGLTDRINAWLQAKSVAEPPENFIIIPSSFNLCDAAEAQAILRIIKQDLGQQPALIVVDTLNRNMQGDENSSLDMPAFVRNVDFLRQQTGATTLSIHHSGWETGRPRGHTSLPGACDAIIELQPASATAAWVRCYKAKDFKRFGDYKLQQHFVDLGHDENREQIGSLVYQFVGTRAGERAEGERDDNAKEDAAYLAVVPELNDVSQVSIETALTIDQLQKRTGLQKNREVEVRNRLVSAGQLEQTPNPQHKERGAAKVLYWRKRVINPLAEYFPS